jgi:hypothetical protein
MINRAHLLLSSLITLSVRSRDEKYLTTANKALHSQKVGGWIVTN